MKTIPATERPTTSNPTKRRRLKHPGGRPTKATPEQLDALADALGDWQKHSTKDAAARAAGISMATLMRWQQQHQWLHDAWEDGSRFRYVLRQQAREARAANRPPRLPGPTRQMRLVCWFLVHRVHPLRPLTAEHARRACQQVNLSLAAWVAACRRFPQLLASVGRKRERRRAYLLQHGEIDLGWTPPDPNDPRTAARAWGSYQQRRGTFLASLYMHERRHSPRRDDYWL